MKTIEIYFVRHGQTIFNKYNRMQGWSDSPLTDKGLADAHNAGQRLADLSFNQVYASDTTRAINTARAIISENKQNPELEVKPEFREEFYGYYEGADSAQTWFEVLMPISGEKTFHNFLEDHKIEDSKDAMKAADPFHDAENNVEFWERLNRGFSDVFEKANDGDHILVASHGTTIRSIAKQFQPDLDVTWGPANGSISKVTMNDDGIQLDFYNNHADTPLN